MYSINDLQNDIAGAIHGTTINQITNPFGIYNRAARDVLAQVDPMETKKTLATAGPIFNGVWDYPIPADFKGNKLIDLSPPYLRDPSQVWQQDYNQAFDLNKNGSLSFNDFTIVNNNYQKYLRINAPTLPQGITLNTCDDINADGTWTTAGTATNLQTNNQNFVSNAGSLSFNLNAGSPPQTGSLVNSTMSLKDLTNHLNQSTLFLYTYLPSGSAITNVTLRWGTDASDYYQVTTTQTQQGYTFQTGWNLLAFPWLGATVVGSPNPASINYLQVSWTYNGTLQTGVLLDTIQSVLGQYLSLEYYSKFLFRDAVTGTFQETVTSNTNLVNLDVDSYQIFFNRVMCLVCQQSQGLDAMFSDGPFFKGEYEAAVQKYRLTYKSEVQKPRSSYYTPNKGGYSQYYGLCSIQ